MKKSILHGHPDFTNPVYAYDNVSLSEVYKLFVKILKPERKFYVAVIIYSLAISLLTLAAPISVQTLITTVANTARVNMVLVLATVLFILMAVASALYVMQVYVMELFERKFFARIVSEIVLQNIYIKSTYFKTINRTELINRYFDIMTVQKNMPQLLIGGFALVLQTLVGLIVVSFYHPALFAFNILFVLCVYLVWRIWGASAIRSALALSNAKYKVAHWLEEMARVNDDFKSDKGIFYALQKSEDATALYMKTRRRHFKFTLAQIIGFLLIYAAFNALLLGLGGALVIAGELTLGQLVAAELILTAIFSGVSRGGYYLSLIYTLVPAVEKISYFFRVPTEIESGKPFEAPERVSIEFENVRWNYRDISHFFNFKIEGGAKVISSTSSHILQEYLIDLVRGYRDAHSGNVYLCNQNIKDYNPHSYRGKIIALDEPGILEGSIDEYLRDRHGNTSLSSINEALKLVHLDHVIHSLPKGLETVMAPTGYPLSVSETLRLKLAAALLAKPKVLILTELYDVLNYHARLDILRALKAIPDLTLLYFTNRRDVDFFDHYLYITPDQDIYCASVQDFRNIDLQREQEESLS